MQNSIRSYNGIQYSIAEGSALIDELNSRTTSDVDEYDNLQKVGDKLKTIVDVTVDSTLSGTSENPLQNKVIKTALDTKVSDAPSDGKLYIRKDNTWDVLTPIYTIEGTYAEIKALKDANQLITGVRYIITDYKTEYFVIGSNSSGIIKPKTITAYVAGWAVLNDNYEYELNNGDTVTITALPSGYSGSLTVGETTTVSSSNADYYFKFANGMQNTIGIEFTFNLVRYQNIANDAVINDANGKPVMRPNGIINTEIHDGTAYCEQTASENLTVPTERIVLLASTNNSFEEVGFSDTFDGDVLHYDFDDTEIKNDNLQVIGSRKGYITRRINTKLNIDTKVDWRVLRFRRWLIDSDSRKKLINQDLDVTTRVGFKTRYLFTSENRTITNTNEFYVANVPEKKFNNIDSNAMKKTFVSVVESNIHCKDFNIIPLDASYNPINIDKFHLDAIWDSVFLNIAGEFSYKIYVDKCTIQGSTFVSNPRLYGNNLGIYDSTFLDSFGIDGSLNTTFNNIVGLSYTSIGKVTNSSLMGVIFGTVKGNIAGNPVPLPAAKWFQIKNMDSCDMKDFVMGQAAMQLIMSGSKFTNSSLFLYYSPITGNSKSTEIAFINNSVFTNVYLRVPRNISRVSFNDLYFNDTNGDSSDGLYIYEMDVGSLTNIKVLKNDADNKLYRTSIDASDVTTVTDVVVATLTP